MSAAFDLRKYPETRDRAYDSVVAFCRDPKGKPIREIAEHFRVNYYTMRIHIHKLVADKRLELVPGFGKATFYRAVDYAGMPEIMGFKLWEVVKQFADASTPFSVTKGTRQFTFNLSRLFYYAGLHFDGGTVTRKQLNELRQSLQGNLAQAERYVEAIKTILNYDELFDSPESLMKSLMMDPDCPVTSKAIDQAYGNHRARYETNVNNV